MTAIVYAAGVMAADSQMSAGDYRHGSVRKITRSPKGTLGAASGQAGWADTFRRWVDTGKIDEWLATGCADPFPVKGERGCFGAIVVEGKWARDLHRLARQRGDWA